MKMEKRKLEMLLIEDSPKFMTDAKQVMDTRIEKGAPVTFTYVGTLDSAMKELVSKRYDGVISDVFFPESEGNYGSRDTLDRCDNLMKFRESWRFEKMRKVCTRILKDSPRDMTIEEFVLSAYTEYKEDHESQLYLRYSEWLGGKSEAPLGVLVSQYAFDNGVPNVLITSTYHHGKKTQPVHEYAMSKNVQIVDNLDETGSKKFEEAYSRLMSLHEDQKNGLVRIDSEGVTRL